MFSPESHTDAIRPYVKINICDSSKMANEETQCGACHRSFSTTGNLNRHLQSSLVCEQWLNSMNTEPRQQLRLFDVIQDNRITSSDILKHLSKPSQTECKYCHRVFSTSDAISKHLRTSVICDKWRTHDVLSKLANVMNGLLPFTKCLMKDSNDGEGLVNKSYKPEIYEKFEAPKYSLLHIIWNVFLVDKEFAKKHDFKNICEDNSVKYMVGIVPNKQEFQKAVDFEMSHGLLVYDGHATDLDLKGFERECRIIEEHRAKRHNVMVFCNSGYQRSLPFLCYYLYKCHRNEVSTIERALDIILPQVDKSSYADVRDKYIESITKLFATNKV